MIAEMCRFLRNAQAPIVVLFCLSAVTPWEAQAPVEVERLDWCEGANDCLTWTAVPGTVDYPLYRGPLTDVFQLIGGDPGACALGPFAAATTGPGLADPSPGSGFWFLVTARNAFGEGTAGSGSASPRTVAATGSCAAGALVLNEVDYDQPGIDTAEFVEVVNAGAGARALAGVALVLVNGGTGEEYGRVALSGAAESLPPGGFLVVGSAALAAIVPVGVPFLALPSGVSLQNGAPDAVALVDVTTGELLDALSYEGEIRAAVLDGLPGSYDLVEGRRAIAEDSSTVNGSLVRLPDGVDRNDAEVDWSFTPNPTPGAPNAP